MTKKEQMQAWVDRWRVAGPMLEKVRREEIRLVNTQKALEHLSGMFEHARLHFRPLPSSGLVEQQALFKKAGRHRS